MRLMNATEQTNAIESQLECFVGSKPPDITVDNAHPSFVFWTKCNTMQEIFPFEEECNILPITGTMSQLIHVILRSHAEHPSFNIEQKLSISESVQLYIDPANPSGNLYSYVFSLLDVCLNCVGEGCKVSKFEQCTMRLQQLITSRHIDRYAMLHDRKETHYIDQWHHNTNFLLSERKCDSLKLNESCKQCSSNKKKWRKVNCDGDLLLKVRKIWIVKFGERGILIDCRSNDEHACYVGQTSIELKQMELEFEKNQECEPDTRLGIETRNPTQINCRSEYVRCQQLLSELLRRSALKVVMFQSRMGMSRVWIANFIDSRFHSFVKSSDNVFYPCVCKDKVKDTCDDEANNSQYRNKLQKEIGNVDETVTVEDMTTHRIPNKLARMVADCSPNKNTGESENYTQSLTQHRKTDVPAFDPHADTNRVLVSLSKSEKSKIDHYQSTEDFEDHISLIRHLTWLPHEDLPIPQIDITVANVLDPVFHQMADGSNPGPRITMKYELLRLCTLRNYPKVDKPYIIRLAGAGFYYAAEGDEVVCYCCGTRRRNWTANCNPMRIHRRMSPNCSFLKNNAEVNVPVPPTPAEEMARFAFLKDLLKDEEEYGSDSGYDTGIAARQLDGNHLQGSSRHTTQSGTSQQGRYSNSSINAPQPPKHPHYGVLATRLDSFRGWPGGNGQDPPVLADAGFYFVGVEDCVRCFQCGVGLRHWAPEDDPWIEHGRWTLKTPCSYLIQKKGEEFVELVRMAIEITENDPLAQSIDAPEDSIPDQDSSFQTTETNTNNHAKGSKTATSAQQTPVNQTGTNTDGSNAVVDHNTKAIKAETGTKGSTAKRSSKKKSTSKPKDNASDEKRTLLAENTRLRDQTMCKVCFERDVCIVFLPCGHLVTCAECAPSLRICPICRKLVKGTVKTYMS